MNIERPGSPSATTLAPTSKRRSASIETRRSRLASERPPKKGVARRNAFRSGELTAIDLIYARSQRRQAGQARRELSAGKPCGYAAAGGPNQVVSAPASPSRVGSPTQATYPSGRINTAVGAVTGPRAGSSHG